MGKDGMSERRAIAASRLFIGVALAILVVGVTTALLLARVVPLTGRQTLIIDGRSMEPTVPFGSAVVITPVPATDLRVGDIVSLRSGPAQSVFTHRITRLAKVGGRPYIETKGDANRDVDPSLTPASAVLGRVDWSLPALGLLVAYLSVPTGALFGLLVGLTLVVSLLLLDELAADAAEDQEERERLAHRLQRGLSAHAPGVGGAHAADR